MPTPDDKLLDRALFDDSRKALVFALNATLVTAPPRPAMTKAMAEGIKKRPRKAPKRGAKASEADPLDEYIKLVRLAFRRPENGLRLSGKDRQTEAAGQAGFILQEFAKLDYPQRAVLTGVLMQSHTPCDCRRPCCSGRAVNLRWLQAVTDTCQILKDDANVMRKPGKRGMSTQPQLRRAVVEAYFTGRELRITDLAAMAECSMVTAAKHRHLIDSWLEKTEHQAWLQIDALFDRVGITGAIF